MTLIMAAVTKGYLILASDRRITWEESDPSASGNARIVSQEDSDTKTIIFDRRYVMGFAGLGRIPVTDQKGRSFQQRIEAWMASDGFDITSAEDSFEALAEQFSAQYQEGGHQRPHAFLAVGYRTDGPRGATDPEVVTIANSRRFRQTFDITREPMDAVRNYMFRSVGEPLSAQQAKTIERALQRSVKRKPRQPYDVIATFVDVMREVADTSEGRVGREILVTTVPRTAIPVEVGATGWLEDPGVLSYLHHEISMTYPDDPSQAPGSRFAPAFVARGRTRVFASEMWVGTGEPPPFRLREGFGPHSGDLANPERD